MKDNVFGSIINVKLLDVLVLLIPVLLNNANNQIVNALMMENHALLYHNVRIIKPKLHVILKELMGFALGYLRFHLT